MTITRTTDTAATNTRRPSRTRIRLRGPGPSLVLPAVVGGIMTDVARKG